MMFFSLMPLSVAFFRAGSTLHSGSVEFGAYEPSNILRWIRRINNDSFLGLVIRHEVGIVIPTALPCKTLQHNVELGVPSRSSKANSHIGIDSICILRAVAGFGGDESARKNQRRAAMPTATALKLYGRLRICFVADMKLMKNAHGYVNR